MSFKRKPVRIVPKKLSFFPVLSTLQQALGLFVFAFFFAVFFDLFYSDGIELKLKGPTGVGLTNYLHQSLSASPVTYAGFRPSTPASIPTPLPADLETMPRLSLAGAKERFDKGSAQFLDARSPEEYRQGHIPGSIDFYADDIDKFAPLVLPKLTDKTREIVTYCHGSACELSIQLAKALMEQGYTHVEVFFGGWPQWQKAGYPIRQGDQP